MIQWEYAIDVKNFFLGHADFCVICFQVSIEFIESNKKNEEGKDV